MSKSFQKIKAYAKSKGLPLIPFHAKDVTIINEPSQFYQSILNYISLSRKRVALSALYLGTGSKENALVKAICDNKKQNNCLNVHIVLDANRATRTDREGQSSITILNKLLAFDQVKLSLFGITTTSDSFVSRLLANYQKWNELTSTFHSKVLIFDNDLIITGANLSDMYFQNRQDRYVIFRDVKQLSDYMFNLLEVINNKTQYNLKDSIKDYNSTFIKQQLETINNNNDENNDSFIIPLNQFGSVDLTDKEDFLVFLDSILPEDARIYLSSGYFNPSPKVDKLKIDSVLAPSEKTNGFYNGQGFLRYVPRLYSALAGNYLNRHPNCDLNLYDKPDWSYHAKGIWCEGLNDIYVHIIGSSNFNYRSSKRDFETQLVILTRNRKFIEHLENERVALWKESSRIKPDNFNGLNFIYNTVAQFVKTFL